MAYVRDNVTHARSGRVGNDDHVNDVQSYRESHHQLRGSRLVPWSGRFALAENPEMPELCPEKRHWLHADDKGRRSSQRGEDSTRARPLPASISTSSLGFTVDTPS